MDLPHTQGHPIAHDPSTRGISFPVVQMSDFPRNLVKMRTLLKHMLTTACNLPS